MTRISAIAASPWRLVPAICVLALAACGGEQGSNEISQQARFEQYTYTSDTGTRSYWVYAPADDAKGSPRPLIVYLHGCSATTEEEVLRTRFNELAESFQVVIVYPEQAGFNSSGGLIDGNGSRCWNWFLPNHQERDAGEPALIAGITREVMSQWNVDARRVYVGGISAGGAMSNIMAVTYPDLYAASMIYAGCEYKGGPSCAGAVAALPAEVSGQLAYTAMGANARVVPVFVVQGAADTAVPPANAELVVQQFLASDDWADDGANNGSVRRDASSTRSAQKPGGRAYDIDDYIDNAGCLLVQRWLIQGSGHIWSGEPANGPPRDSPLTDVLGPDVSTATFEFFLSQVMPEQDTACAVAP